MTNRKSSYTPEQKQAYFSDLRKQYQAAKTAAAENGDVKKIYAHLQSLNITNLSAANIQLVLEQAAELGLDGVPYLDFKTYEHWKKSGYQVTKGEKSKVYTITWVSAKNKSNENSSDSDEASGYRFPKLTHLFHSSQVEALS
jgi:hypothetical protein